MPSAVSLFDIPGVWRGERARAKSPAVPTGNAQLDGVLLGGWPIGALTQIIGSQEGLGVSLIFPALARLTKQGQFIALIQTPHLPNAPCLASQGIDLRKLLWIQPDSPEQALWSMEQLTRSGLFGAVAYWGRSLDSVAERRLQLAADTGNCLAFCFRPSRAEDHTYSAVRIEVSPGKEGRLDVDVLKCRGTRAGRRISYRPWPNEEAA